MCREKAVDDVHSKVGCLREKVEACVCLKDLREEVDHRWHHDPINMHLMSTNYNLARDMTRTEREQSMVLAAGYSGSGGGGWAGVCVRLKDLL